MIRITESERPDLRHDAALTRSGNRLPPDLRLNNAEIVFRGENNLVVTDGPVELRDSVLELESDNSLVFLAQPADAYQIRVRLGFGCTLYIGPGCEFAGPAILYGAEGTNIIIGRDCRFARNAEIRSADLFPLWDATTSLRRNPAASVYLGDHVRLEEDARVLRGVTMGSGSVLAERAVANKSTGPNLALAGNPARIVARHVCWTRHDTLLGPHDQPSGGGSNLPPLLDEATPLSACRFEPPLGREESPESQGEKELQELYTLCENALRAGFDPAPKAAFLRNVVLPFGLPVTPACTRS